LIANISGTQQDIVNWKIALQSTNLIQCTYVRSSVWAAVVLSIATHLVIDFVVVKFSKVYRFN